MNMNNILKEINLPSDIKNFKKVINLSLQILEDVDSSIFFSPFSVMPIISQFLGLNTPLLGSGDSPYSIVSLAFQLHDKGKLLDEIFAIPLLEKRRILDEIYEMIAPYLLDESKEYIDLLLETKYKGLLESDMTKISHMKEILSAKFSILSSFINRFDNKNGDFGYIVHYGYPEDLYREFDFLERLPDNIAKDWRDRSYPIVNEMFMRGFPQSDKNTKQCLKGWILFITNYTRELLEDGKLRKKKIIQAAKLAERLGAKLVGMGGLIGSFAQGGYYLAENVTGVGFTTGHAYTIGNVIDIMQNCIDKVKLDIKKSTVAIVGAAGSIGSGCAKLLAKKSPRQVILVDLSNFNAVKAMKKLRDTIKEIDSNIKVEFSTKLMDIKTADIVISATNSPVSLISSKHLKPGAIIIDDAFPKNVNKGILDEREDIILLEGGIMQFPLDIDIYFSRNMPDLLDAPLTRLISCKESYGCLAEAFTLALYNHQKNYGLGYANIALAKDIMLKAQKVGFSSAPLQCFDEAIEEKRFRKVEEIIKRKHKG